MTQYIITSGTTWSVPADWNNADNKIEAIGGGGGGSAGTVSSAGAAGGGAAYASVTNTALTPSSAIDIQVGVGGVSGLTAPTASWVKNNSGTKVVEADYGKNPSGSGIGGQASASTGSIKYSGGTGGSGGGRGGSGGGGSAGPSGDGKNGGNSAGGAERGGSGGGGSNGTSATAGTTASSGSGGNGGSVS